MNLLKRNCEKVFQSKTKIVFRTLLPASKYKSRTCTCVQDSGAIVEIWFANFQEFQF